MEGPASGTGGEPKQGTLEKGGGASVAGAESGMETAKTAGPDLTGVIEFMVSVFPGLMIMGIILVSWANFLIGRLLVARSVGLWPEVADLTRWRAPEILVWGLIGCGFALFLPVDWLKLVGLNGLLVLALIYFFHGLSIVAFWMKKMSTPPFFRALGYTMIVVLQWVTLLVAVLGLFDLWLDFRKMNKAEPGDAA
jgi:uncharacterized protein YybS (DUF2232 family)